MAHRGRLYPVNFRRDFNANCDIRSKTTLPETWRVTLHSGVVPPYPIDGTVFICTPTTPFTVRHLNWISEWKPVAGKLWRLSAILEFTNLPGAELFGTWQLERNDKGLVNYWRSRLPDLYAPFQYIPLEAAVLFSDITVFPFGAQFYFSDTVAAGY